MTIPTVVADEGKLLTRDGKIATTQQCCGSCQQLYDADSVLVDLVGNDYQETRTGQQNVLTFGGERCCSNGCSLTQRTTGSRYNGTFECDFVAAIQTTIQSQFGNYRHYQYTFAELCGQTSALNVFVSLNPVKALFVQITNAVRYFVWNYESQDAITDFVCSDSTECCGQLPAPDSFSGRTFGIGLRRLECPCEFQPLNLTMDTFSSFSSSDNCNIFDPFAGLTTVSESGTLRIRISRVYLAP